MKPKTHDVAFDGLGPSDALTRVSLPTQVTGMASALARKRIALTVIGGFLGAGKTTLLNRWLRDAGGRRMAVLVNDFGAINIDAALIASSNANTIALTNGCVCCSIGDDLSQALVRVLDASPPFEGIVIEASGVSDPWRIAQIGLAEPSLSLDGVIVVLDAEALADQLNNPLLRDSIERPVARADLLVLNKIDLTNAAALQSARNWLRAAAPQVHCAETIRAEVPLALLSSAYIAWRDANCDMRCHGHGNGHGNGRASTGHACDGHDFAHEHRHEDDVSHDRQFAVWSCRPSRGYELADIKTWLKLPPAGLLRLKGFVQTHESGWSEVQFSGRTGSVRRALSPPESAALVAIGLHGSLPRAALDAFWRGA